MGETNAKTLHLASKRPLVVRLHDQVNMIGQDREMGNRQAVGAGLHDRRTKRLILGLSTKTRKPLADPDRDMQRFPHREPWTGHVRLKGRGALPPGAGAGATVTEAGSETEWGLEAGPGAGRHREGLPCPGLKGQLEFGRYRKWGGARADSTLKRKPRDRVHPRPWGAPTTAEVGRASPPGARGGPGEASGRRAQAAGASADRDRKSVV